MTVSELQKKIGVLLYKKPMTAEELAEELNADINDVMEALKGLLLMKVVTKEGNPPVYKLAPHVIEAIKSDESEGILVHAIIEVEGVERSLVEKGLNKIKDMLEKEGGFILKDAYISSIEEDRELNVYYGHLDVTIVFPAVEPLIYFLFYYGPTVVEVLSPDRIEVDSGDLQRALTLAASMIQGYVSFLSRKLSKEELKEFNLRLLKGLRE